MENDAYYFHNIRATVLFSFSQKAGFDWLSVQGNGFGFYHNPETGRVWKTSSYFPISVTRNIKPWGHFDIQRRKLHIITRGDFDNQLNSFVVLLKKHIPNVVLKAVFIKYAEICTRYEDKYFDKVGELIKKAESRFFTNTKTDSFDKRIKGQTWLTLGRELSIEKTRLNIKTYRYVDEIETKKRTISDSILPKIEVQLYSPESLEKAKQIAIPIIKAFQEHVGFKTMSMDNEPDYAKIQGILPLSHNQKLVDLFNENASVTALKFPKTITQDNLTYEIACFLTPGAKSRKEILAKYKINESKLNRVLNTLNPYLEKRGNNAIGLFYQIDPQLIEKHSDNNKGKGNVLTTDRVNSTSNKSSKASSQFKKVAVIKQSSTTEISINKVIKAVISLIISELQNKTINFLAK